MGHLLAMADRMLLAAVVPALRSGLGDAQLGLVLGPAFAVPYGLAALGFGHLADRGARRVLIVGGMAAWSLASLATGLCSGLPALVGVRIVLGLGQAAFIPAALAMLVDLAGPDRRAAPLAGFAFGSAVGRSGVLLVAGAVLAVLAAVGIAETAGGWRLLFAVTVVPNLAVLACLTRVRWPAVPASAPRADLGWVRANAAAVAGYIAVVAMPILVAQSLAAWLPTLVVRRLGIGVAEAASLAGGLLLASAPAGPLLGGWLMSRSEAARRQPMLTIAGALCVALPFVAMVGGSSVAWVSGVGIVGGSTLLGVASFTGLYGLQAMVPADRRGVVNGLLVATTTLVGLGVGPWATGLLSDSGGRGLGAALLLVATGAAAIAGLTATLGRGAYAAARARAG